MTSVYDPDPVDALGELTRFRREFYDFLTARVDLAAQIMTTSSSPGVSVTMNRLLPLIFFPASNPRLARPTVSAPLTLWESSNPVDGGGRARGHTG